MGACQPRDARCDLTARRALVAEEDVRRACLALSDVTERLSWGQPAWFAQTLMARMWEDGVLTVKTDERDALAGSHPETYFWTPPRPFTAPGARASRPDRCRRAGRAVAGVVPAGVQAMIA